MIKYVRICNTFFNTKDSCISDNVLYVFKTYSVCGQHTIGKKPAKHQCHGDKGDCFSFHFFLLAVLGVYLPTIKIMYH